MMSDKLEAAIKMEIGADNGREMPEVKGISWTLNSKVGETVWIRLRSELTSNVRSCPI